MDKQRLKNYGLWVAVIALIPMLCESFALKVLPANYEDVSTAILGILVLLGIINNPTSGKGFLDTKEDK